MPLTWKICLYLSIIVVIMAPVSLQWVPTGDCHWWTNIQVYRILWQLPVDVSLALISFEKCSGEWYLWTIRVTTDVALRLAQARCHVIYTDPDLNRTSVIYLNIYRNFILVAMKMHCYLREWHAGWYKQTSLICSPSWTSSKRGKLIPWQELCRKW